MMSPRKDLWRSSRAANSWGKADRQELEYQTRKAALRGLAPPHTVFRMPDGCAEAKRHESERQQTAGKATE